MTATIEETVVDDFVLVDEKIKIEDPCDFYDICKSSADWLLEVTCCGKQMMLCSDCLITLKEWLRTNSGNKEYVCRFCNHFISANPDWLRVIKRIKA